MNDVLVIRFRGRSVSVRESIVVGRSPHCDIVIQQDPNVSRAHARFSPQGPTLLLQDLNSVNGVQVNGVRVGSRANVRAGDLIRIGSSELVVGVEGRTAPEVPSVPGPNETDTLRLVRSAVAPSPAAKPSHRVFTQRADEAEFALDEGNWTKADHLLDVAAWALVDEVAATGELDPLVQERACTFAVRLATATRDGMWVNFLLSLHTAANRPMPRAVAASLPRLVHDARNVDEESVYAYLEVMRAVYPRLTPVERQLCGSLETAHLLVSVLRRP